MKKTLLIGLAFLLGTWAASYLDKAPPKLESGQPTTNETAGQPARPVEVGQLLLNEGSLHRDAAA
jgi:hypothetical protein